MKCDVDENNIEILLKKNIRANNASNKNRINFCNKTLSKNFRVMFKYIINFCCENLQR